MTNCSHCSKRPRGERRSLNGEFAQWCVCAFVIVYGMVIWKRFANVEMSRISRMASLNRCNRRRRRPAIWWLGHLRLQLPSLLWSQALEYYLRGSMSAFKSWTDEERRRRAADYDDHSEDYDDHTDKQWQQLWSFARALERISVRVPQQYGYLSK